jgi:hypothetical protein
MDTEEIDFCFFGCAFFAPVSRPDEINYFISPGHTENMIPQPALPVSSLYSSTRHTQLHPIIVFIFAYQRIRYKVEELSDPPQGIILLFIIHSFITLWIKKDLSMLSQDRPPQSCIFHLIATN